MAGREYATNCGTCGVPREERTTGCPQCNNRHGKWKKKGDPRYKEPAPQRCIDCGIEVSRVNPGCKRCAIRERQRKNAADRNRRMQERDTHHMNVVYYQAWVDQRRKRIARRERLLAAGRRPIV